MRPGTKGIRTLCYLLNNFIFLFHFGVELLVVIGFVVVVVVVPVTVVPVVGSGDGGVVVVVVPETVVEGVEDVVVFEREFRSKGTVDTVFLSFMSTSVLLKPESGTRTRPRSQL